MNRCVDHFLARLEQRRRKRRLVRRIRIALSFKTDRTETLESATSRLTVEMVRRVELQTWLSREH